MRVKLLEIRDDGTMIPALCVDMNPGPIVEKAIEATGEDEFERYMVDRAARAYLLRRCGYACDGRPNIAITHLDAGGQPCWNDPHGWGGRTYPVAHHYIIKNWDQLRDGDVVDVEFILGETTAPKVSERVTAPL